MKKHIKNVTLEWLRKEENDHNYISISNEDLTSVTLDGSFNLQDLIDKIHSITQCNLFI